LCGIISRLIGLFSPRHKIILNGQRKQERRRKYKNNPARVLKSEQSRHCHIHRERGKLWRNFSERQIQILYYTHINKTIYPVPLHPKLAP
jgi:hypothetical protein